MPAFLVSRDGGGGLRYGATRNSRYRTPTTGVRTLREESAWIDDVRAVALVMPRRAVFSHHTAAQLLGLPLPRHDGRPLHVTVPPGTARGRRKGVAWHEAEVGGHVIAIGGLQTTDPGRTWLDLGSTLALPDLVAIADLMLRRNLCPELPVAHRIRGARTLRRALALADPRSRSPWESILRVEVHLAGLPSPEVNFDIIHKGEWVGCGDLVWPAYMLYVEYDGSHHQDPRQRHQDAQTRNRLMSLGWSVRVVTSPMMRHTHEVVAMLAEELVARGWTP